MNGLNIERVTIKHDKYFSVMFFKYNDITVGFGIPETITDMHVKKYYSNGCIEFNTNKGIESIDIIYGSEKLYTNKQLNVLYKLFSGKIQFVERSI